MELVQEDVGSLRKFALRRVGADLVPHVEGMLGALCLLFAAELAARRKHAVLRLEVDLFRRRWRCWGARLDSSRGGKAAAEAFEVLLLFLAELAHFDSALAGVAAGAGRGRP